MEHVFWLVPGELCGRPGPNYEPWQLADIRDIGVGAILSVNSAESVYEDELQAADLAHRCVPLAANAPPREGDVELCLERLPQAYEFASEHIRAGHGVLVHCRHGKDRTGLFMAYYLQRRYRLSAEQALEKLWQARPIALSADGWQELARDVLRHTGE